MQLYLISPFVLCRLFSYTNRTARNRVLLEMVQVEDYNEAQENSHEPQSVINGRPPSKEGVTPDKVRINVNL